MFESEKSNKGAKSATKAVLSEYAGKSAVVMNGTKNELGKTLSPTHSRMLRPIK